MTAGVQEYKTKHTRTCEKLKLIQMNAVYLIWFMTLTVLKSIRYLD